MAFGRLERSGPPRPMSDINMTPLIDVMLVLLVIFIVAAPLIGSSLKLDLPEAEGASPGGAPAFIELAIDAHGRLFLGESPVEPEALVERVREAARTHPDTEVRLRADEAVPYGQVAALIGRVQAAGLSRIALVATPPPAAN